MNRQSLETKFDELIVKYITGYNSASANDSFSQLQANDEHFKAALLKTVDRYVEERERLVREDEQKIVGEWLATAGHFGTIKDFHSLRLLKLQALRQQVKGGQE